MKNNMKKEILRMKRLSGIISESVYSERLNEFEVVNMDTNEESKRLEEVIGPLDKQFFEKTEAEINSLLNYKNEMETKMYQQNGGNQNGVNLGNYEDYDAATGNFTNISQTIDRGANAIATKLADWKRRDNSLQYMSQELSDRLSREKMI